MLSIRTCAGSAGTIFTNLHPPHRLAAGTSQASENRAECTLDTNLPFRWQGSPGCAPHARQPATATSGLSASFRAKSELLLICLLLEQHPTGSREQIRWPRAGQPDSVLGRYDALADPSWSFTLGYIRSPIGMPYGVISSSETTRETWDGRCRR